MALQIYPVPRKVYMEGLPSLTLPDLRAMLVRSCTAGPRLADCHGCGEPSRAGEFCAACIGKELERRMGVALAEWEMDQARKAVAG